MCHFGGGVGWYSKVQWACQAICSTLVETFFVLCLWTIDGLTLIEQSLSIWVLKPKFIMANWSHFLYPLLQNLAIYYDRGVGPKTVIYVYGWQMMGGQDGYYSNLTQFWAYSTWLSWWKVTKQLHNYLFCLPLQTDTMVQTWSVMMPIQSSLPIRRLYGYRVRLGLELVLGFGFGL